MKMKHLLSLILALALMLGCAGASAATLEARTELSGRGAQLTDGGAYVLRADGGYALFQADSAQLSDFYGSMYARSNSPYCEVQNENGINKQGAIDATGKLVVPMQYGDLKYEEGWILGVKLEETEEMDGDYKSSDKRYLITSVDVYFGDKLAATLSREEYRACNYRVYGQYLMVEINGSGFSLKEDGTRTDYTGEKLTYIREYEETKQGYIHNATNQLAFVPGCTLTADEVEQSVMYDSKQGFVDLQGNVLAPLLPNVSYARFNTSFFTYSINRLDGATDLAGNTILQPVYDEIAYDYDNEALFPNGYQAVIKDGKLCYIDANENVTASVDYDLESTAYKGFTYNAPMVYVENLGKVMVITATKGELPETYKDAKIGRSGQRILAVQKDDLWGVIDMDGQVVVPFEMKYSPDITPDGRYVLGQADRVDVLYTISYGEAAAPATAVEPVAEPDTAVTSAPAASPYEKVSKHSADCPYTWTGEAPKFCPECGVAIVTADTPVDTTPQCSGCGLIFEGDVPKFCPDCGTKIETATPEPTATPAPAKCAGCGYMPEGDAPKFCPECGAKFGE